MTGVSRHYECLVGFTRLGNLLGLLDRGEVKEAARYLAWVGRPVQEGAAGVDMGRNIFQSEAPVAMIQAVGSVVHDNLTPAKAYEMYLDLKTKG